MSKFFFYLLTEFYFRPAFSDHHLQLRPPPPTHPAPFTRRMLMILSQNKKDKYNVASTFPKDNNKKKMRQNLKLPKKKSEFACQTELLDNKTKLEQSMWAASTHSQTKINVLNPFVICT